ncbi:MAG: L-threonylcarbamoyladenylate synthase [Clostridia bacterium]|nr:L-threonylcarbamoyladenylate synthase [Clostridia bacterium]
MKTEIVPQKKGFAKAVELINSGELVAFSTETVYGLGADFSNSKAVAKIFEAKGRPQDNPLIVHLAKAEDAELVAIDIPLEYYALAKKFMPGPLTIVLKKRSNVPDVVTAGGSTVAVRVPKNKTVRNLIALSHPLAAPSANRSKHISPTTAEHVALDLDGSVSLILDGGECKVGIESTVLDLTSKNPTILRPGAVTADMLLTVLSSVSEKHSTKIKVAKSPGMKYEHYSPICETVMGMTINSSRDAYDKAQSEGKKPVYVCLHNAKIKFGHRDTVVLGKTIKDYARNFYGALRYAETIYDYIIIEALDESGLGNSVMNRATKSAGGKFV